MNKNWGKFGLHIPEILVPKKGTDYYKWAVVACDQYTSEPEYWEEVNKIVGDAPSTNNLMLPELYLGSDKEDDKIKSIRNYMDKYLSDGTLINLGKGCMLVEREAEGRKRLGLVIATDLEKYDYSKGSKTLTRATEATVVERIPPRLKIRDGAKLEMPHIMILIDDPDKTVIEPLINKSGEVIYDTDLMLNGGHVKGTFLKESDLDSLYNALDGLYENAVEKYGEGNVILQAMGDGNHSLATAKANWENIKKNLSADEIENHPSRFALCEIENIHDRGIVFEPIHRVVFGKNGKNGYDLLCEVLRVLGEENGNAYMDLWTSDKEGDFSIPFISNTKEGYIIVEKPSHSLEVGVITNALDILSKEMGICEIDYVHGEDTVRKLSKEENNLGFLLPSMDKFSLFPAVASDGSLPRKTFSMGEANEKRYYIECRSLIK